MTFADVFAGTGDMIDTLKIQYDYTFDTTWVWPVGAVK